MNDGLFVITDDDIFLLCEGLDRNDDRICLEHRVPVKEMKGVFFKTKKDRLDILVADPYSTDGFIAVTLKRQGDPVPGIVSGLCDKLRLDRNKKTDIVFSSIYNEDILLWKNDKIAGFIWDEEASSDVSYGEFTDRLYDRGMSALALEEDVSRFINVMDEYLYSGRSFEVTVRGGTHVWRWKMWHNPLTSGFAPEWAFAFLFDSEDKQDRS